MKVNFLTNLFKKSSQGNADHPIKTKELHESSAEEVSDALIESGKLKNNAKNYKEAINDFTKAIELNPLSISAYLERGKAKNGLNDKIGADKDFDKGKRLYENLDEGLKANDAANAYYDANDFKNAIKNYNKAINLIPTCTSIYYYRGCSKKYLGDYQAAVEDFDKSIQTGASNKADAYYQRSIIKSHQLNDKDGALDDLHKAIGLNSKEADYYYARAKLLDDYDGIQDLNKAIELSPSDANNYLSRALKKRGMEDYQGSISDLTKYIDLNSDDTHLTISEAYALRAGIRLLSDDLQGSLKDYTIAVETDPSNFGAFIDRGILKDVLRDFEGAINDFTVAIKLNPKSADAFIIGVP